MYCPNCNQEQENTIMCNNDCGTYICIVCDIEYHYDHGKDYYVEGHVTRCEINTQVQMLEN
jgi:hypothetical protein